MRAVLAGLFATVCVGLAPAAPALAADAELQTASRAAKPGKGANYRSAKSGRFVTKGYATRNKNTTVRETKSGK